MKTKKLQHQIDLIINKRLLWVVPEWLKPNFFTWLRIACVPLLFWLLEADYYTAGLVLFMFAASTDFVDGALARTRDQETELGIIIDPIADKLLIGTVLAVLGIQYLIVQIFLVFMALEIVAILLSSFLAYKVGRHPGANFYGKIKMILQSTAVIFLLPGIILNNYFFVQIATTLLVIALIFAVLSAYQQINAKINNIFRFLKLDKSIQTLKNLLKKI